MFLLSFVVLITFTTLWLAAYITYQLYVHPLSRFPGPLFAKITPFWRFYHELLGDLPLVIHTCHQKYGAFVRVSPSEINTNAPEVVDVVYKRGGRHYIKSEFYDGFTAIKPNMFGTRDEAEHSLRRRQMAHAFSQGSLLRMEYIFDFHVRKLIAKLDEKAKGRETFNLGWMLRYYAHDNNGDLSMGLKYGMLEIDDPHALPPLNEHIALAKLTGYVPMLKVPLAKYGMYLPWPYMRRILSSRRWIGEESKRVTDEEFKRVGRDDLNDKTAFQMYPEDEEPGRINLLTALVSARDPETRALIERDAVTSNAVTFLAAGSHSTAATLEIWFWYILQHPKIRQRVVDEIDAAFPAPATDNEVLEFSGLESRLPYAAAVFKEAFRLSPTFQHTAPRITPGKESAKYPTIVADTALPAGCAVSASVYSLHRNIDIWGEDAECFKPERWLNDQRAKDNEGLLMHFGAGHRACIGRNQAMIALWKAVVEVLRRFEVSLPTGASTKDENPRMRVTGFAELAKPLEVRMTRRKRTEITAKRES